MTLRTVLCTLLLASGATLAAQERPLWLRYPSISPDGRQIAFAYQGDIYTVPTTGGEARRLTTASSYESQPVWSPDGRYIAFTSDRNSEGTNIYLIPATGGELRQLTTHSGTETPQCFTPDGRYLVFKAHLQDPAASALYPASFLTELYRVPVTGGRPELVTATPVEAINFSADGKRFLYQDIKSYEDPWRKHHTSSASRDLWEYDLTRGSYRPIVQHDGEDRDPIYSPDGKNLYFLSERAGGSMNVYSRPLYDTTATPRALTQLKGDPVRFLSSSQAGLLCFGYAGEIYTLAPGGREQRVPISIVRDSSEGEQLTLSMSRSLGSSSVSPDGKQIAFISRGDVFVTSADYATTKQVTFGSQVDRGVTFGRDSRSLIYASCKDGSWALYEARIARSEDPNFPNATQITERRLELGVSGEQMYPQISPDGTELAFVLDRERIMIHNLRTGKTRQVTDGRYAHERSGAIDFNWSPDGKWLALTYVARDHAPYSDIGLVSTSGDGKVYNLTNSGYRCWAPRWSRDGQSLVYLTERYGMRNHASWGSQTDVMMVFLNRAAHEQYLRSEEEQELYKEQEKQRAKAKSDSTSTKAEAKPSTAAKKETRVEWDDLDLRTVRLTPRSATLGDLIMSPDGQKLYYLSSTEGSYDLWVHDLRKHTTGLLRKLGLSSAFFDSDREGKNYFILGASPQKFDPRSETLKPISLSGRRSIDRAAERRAMYEEVVREEAARFYRKDMHGVNWPKLTDHYRRYLPYISHSQDFAELLAELLGELNVSHTGGRYRTPPSAFPTAELGLFVSSPRAGDGLVVDEVVAGGPFDRSDSRLRQGALILALDGQQIKAGMDYFPLLSDKAGKRLLVRFRNTDGSEYEEVIRPITAGQLSALLYRRWVKQRAAEVDKASGGKYGYVHIPSMADEHFRTAYSEALGRYYDRKGIVIDIRYNGGGRLHEDIEVFFSGKQYLTQEVRGKDYCEMPSRRWNKPSVMLTCEADYSNAHGTPWVYQHQRIGKVVGMPVAGTMTSVNWDTLLDPSLYYGIPAVGYRTAEGTYLENTQMTPDVIIPLDPEKVLRGIDTQLLKAVEVLGK